MGMKNESSTSGPSVGFGFFAKLTHYRTASGYWRGASHDRNVKPFPLHRSPHEETN